MGMELIQNIWPRYGFRGNPFDTAVLSASAGALLPVGKAIAGRDMESTESKMLLGVLRSFGDLQTKRATNKLTIYNLSRPKAAGHIQRATYNYCSGFKLICTYFSTHQRNHLSSKPLPCPSTPTNAVSTRH